MGKHGTQLATLRGPALGGPLTSAISQRERETSSAAPGAVQAPEAAVTDKSRDQSVDETTTDRAVALTEILPLHYHLTFEVRGVRSRSRYTEGGLRIVGADNRLRIAHGQIHERTQLELTPAQAEWLASWCMDFVNGNLRERSGVECARCAAAGSLDDETGLSRDRDCPDCAGEGTVNLLDVFEAKPRAVRMDDQPRRVPTIAGVRKAGGF